MNIITIAEGLNRPWWARSLLSGWPSCFVRHYVWDTTGGLGECRLRICANRFPFCLHFWGQNGQLNIASFPHSNLKCLDKVCSHLYPFPHEGQVNGLSSADPVAKSPVAAGVLLSPPLGSAGIRPLPPPLGGHAPPPKNDGDAHSGRRWRSSRSWSLCACWINRATTIDKNKIIKTQWTRRKVLLFHKRSNWRKVPISLFYFKSN